MIVHNYSNHIYNVLFYFHSLCRQQIVTFIKQFNKFIDFLRLINKCNDLLEFGQLQEYCVSLR